MTILNFKKTRIVYWENKLNTVSWADKNWSTRIDFNSKDPNPYNIHYVDPDKHNWHEIPTNYWCLYTTEGQLMNLFDMSEHIKPLKAQCTIAHGVPIAKYAQTNTTNLSFNNTIYSLTHMVQPNDNLTIGSPFAVYTGVTDCWTQSKNMIDFARSFDGASIRDNTRMVLPKPRVYFKVPGAIATTGLGFTVGNQSREILIAKGINDTNQAADVTAYLADTAEDSLLNDDVNLNTDQPITTNDLEKMYYPEFLQNNEHTKALYPGENKDMWSFEDSENSLAGINTATVTFNEDFNELDVRNYISNSNVNFYDFIQGSMNVWPQCRGPNQKFTYDNTLTNTTGNPYTEFDTFLKQNADLYVKFAAGFTHKDLYTKIMPRMLIKCLPILDSDNALVLHSVCGTLTHELTVEIKDRMFHMPSPYQWSTVLRENQRLIKIVVDPSDATKKVRQTVNRTVYKRKISSRMLHNSHIKSNVPRIRSLARTDAADKTADRFIPPLPSEGDTVLLPMNFEIQPNAFRGSTDTAYSSSFLSNGTAVLATRETPIEIAHSKPGPSPADL